MAAIGEESGALDEMLEKAAIYYEEAVDNSVDNLTSLLEPMIMSVLGVLVGGLLIAIYPCMHIVGVKPMYSSESLTQVVLFVWHVLSYLGGVTWAIYDFACGG